MRILDSQEFEYGPGKIYDGVPSSPGLEVGGQSYSHFLKSAVIFSLFRNSINGLFEHH